jgi:hypothetical protein
MSDPLSLAALAGGLSWASGIRLYMALFMAGWFSWMGWIGLPGDLQVLSSPWVMLATGTLCVLEFLADKIPGVDSAWDAIQTFIRIPAGAVLGAAAFGDMNPAVTMVAALLGGTVAAGAHLTKAGSRALINTSPEPFSNWAASFSEDVVVAGALLAAFFHPWLLFALLLVFCVAAAWLLPKLWRGARRVFRGLGA